MTAPESPKKVCLHFFSHPPRLHSPLDHFFFVGEPEAESSLSMTTEIQHLSSDAVS